MELASVFKPIKAPASAFQTPSDSSARSTNQVRTACDQSSTFFRRIHWQQVSEKGLSAMERFTSWLNQKAAKILEDFHRPKPVEDPRPTRAVCRIFVVVSLLLGFSLLLLYNFIDAPDARVVQMYHVTPKGKNHAFPSCFLNDRNSKDCMKWPMAKFPERTTVSCPCTNTSAPWKNFVKFYALHETSPDWNMYPTRIKLPYLDPNITLPDDTIPLGSEYITKDTEFLTAEHFCNVSSLWPVEKNSTDVPGEVIYIARNVSGYQDLRRDCLWMATLLFNGSNQDYEDRTRSTRFLNTRSLLTREELNTVLAQLAQQSVLTRLLALNMVLTVDAGKSDYRRFYNALAEMLIGLLDRDQMDPNQSYVYGAKELSYTLSSNQLYDSKTMVWYMGDISGPIFVQPEIDWEAYRYSCFPEYCEVIKSMRWLRKLYWAFAILGGVSTIIFTVVKRLLWPCTATILVWISGRRTAATTRKPHDPEAPESPLVRL